MKGQKGYALVARHSSRSLSFKALMLALGRRILRWHELNRQRRELAQLSDSTLKDLGLSRADIEVESRSPFWRDPLQK